MSLSSFEDSSFLDLTKNTNRATSGLLIEAEGNCHLLLEYTATNSSSSGVSSDSGYQVSSDSDDDSKNKANKAGVIETSSDSSSGPVSERRSRVDLKGGSETISSSSDSDEKEAEVIEIYSSDEEEGTSQATGAYKSQDKKSREIYYDASDRQEKSCGTERNPIDLTNEDDIE